MMIEEIELRTCAICGKKFTPAPFHVYRDKRIRKDGRHPLVCSYHCMLQSERMEEDRKKAMRKERRIKVHAEKDNRADNT